MKYLDIISKQKIENVYNVLLDLTLILLIKSFLRFWLRVSLRSESPVLSCSAREFLGSSPLSASNLLKSTHSSSRLSAKMCFITQTTHKEMTLVVQKQKNTSERRKRK